MTPEIPGETPAGPPMDDKDRLLISLLRQDARRPIVALARELGLSRSATQERLARLRASGAIAGFTLVEAAAQGLMAYLLVRLQPGRRCAQVLPALRKVPAVVAAHSVAGSIDLILTVHGPDIAAVEQAREAVDAADGVAEVSTHVVLERHMG
jgi:Lrp/AsnC family leucine-responsive transcriptional regulator